MNLFQFIKTRVFDFLPIYRLIDVIKRDNIAYGKIQIKPKVGKASISEYKLVEILNNKDFLDGFNKKDIFIMTLAI